jgi:hypothetical protein
MQLTGEQLFTLLVASITLLGTLVASVTAQWIAGRRSRAEYWRDRQLNSHMAYLAALRRLASLGGAPKQDQDSAYREALALMFESEFFGRGMLDYNAQAMLDAAMEAVERGRPNSEFWQGYAYYVELVMKTVGKRRPWRPWRNRSTLEG